jgi:mannose/fructose/N-acetylgalactosamine-specific phosphotransferase system component IIB
MEVALARIDDRLIHGQVVTAWVRAIGRCDRIVICDDDTSRDDFLQSVLRQIAPPRLPVEVLSVEDTITRFRDGASDPSRVLLLSRGPEAMLALLESGVEFDHLNVGGIGAGPGRTTLHRNVAASDDELEALREIERRGVRVEVKMVPGDRGIALSDLEERGR